MKRKLRMVLSATFLDVGASLALLGTFLKLTDVTKHDVGNRIAAGWKMFQALKQLLSNEKVSTRRRL